MTSNSGPIWRDGGFHPDEWIHYTPDSALLAGDYSLLVPLGLFLAEPERFLAHEGALGVEVAAGEAVVPLEPYLARLTLIALAFPKFSDGRSYSAARLRRPSGELGIGIESDYEANAREYAEIAYLHGEAVGLAA